MSEANLHLEKRTHPRVSLKVHVKYKAVDDNQEMKGIQDWRKAQKNTHTLDISLGGMYLALDHKANLGEILNLEIQLSDQSFLRAFAEVMWANPQGAGLRFLMIKPEDLERLKNFITRSSSK